MVIQVRITNLLHTELSIPLLKELTTFFKKPIFFFFFKKKKVLTLNFIFSLKGKPKFAGVAGHLCNFRFFNFLLFVFVFFKG
jgi:hypothetical protein